MTDRGEGDQALEEAASWLARLNKRSVSSEELEEFYVWRREPGHAAAYADAERLWRDARALGDDRDIALAVRDALERPRRSRFSNLLWPVGRRQLAAGAAFVLLGAAGVAFLASRPVEYETAVGEQRLVRLEDGSRLRLNTDTSLRVDYSSDEREIELVRGEAFFEVRPNSERPFSVESGPLEVRAVGTRFNVRRLGRDFRVVLVDGAVVVANEAEPASPSRLSSGDALTVGPDGQSRIAAIDVEAATGWVSGRMIFKETPLSEAIAEANRYSRRKIKLRSDSLGRLRVDGSFEAGDMDAFVSALTALFPLQADEADGNIILSAA